MPKKFLISQEEKERILSLHENVNRRKPISEQIVTNYDSKYDYKKDNDDYFFKLKSSETWKKANGQPLEAIKTKVFNNKSLGQKTNTKSLPDTPFKNSKEGNEFRQWVNNTYPKYANSINLDREGNYNNNYIKKAWSKYGNEYSKVKKTEKTNISITPDDSVRYQRDTFDPYHQKTQQMMQMDKMTESFRKDLIGVISNKSHKQLVKMMVKGSLSNKSFIIVNKDAAIASLFGPGYSFVAKSPITTGYFKDTGSKEDTLTYEKWFNFTKEYMLKNIKSLEYIANKKFADSLGLSVKDLDYNKHVKGKNKFKFSYTVLKEKGYAKTPSGTYKLGSGYSAKGYSGDGKNTFPLIDIDSGEQLPAAVHGAAGKKRNELIKKAGSLDTQSSKEFTRAGSGCTNVNAKFIADMQKTKPEYVIILPDSGTTVDIPKMVTIKTWSDKILSMGEACAKSFYSLFS